MKQNQDLRKALALILAMFMLAFSGCSHSAPESVGSSESAWTWILAMRVRALPCSRTL